MLLSVVVIVTFSQSTKELSCKDLRFISRLALGATTNSFKVSADPSLILIGESDSMYASPYTLSIDIDDPQIILTHFSLGDITESTSWYSASGRFRIRQNKLPIFIGPILRICASESTPSRLPTLKPN